MKKYIILLFFIVFAYANNLKKVSVQLQWKNQFEYAGFYIAKEKGYYKSIGLDVSLKEWEYGVNISDDVISQKSQYGVSRPSSLIDISNGKELIYLAAIYQSNPLILLANKNKEIDSISKFRNKKIMITKDHIKDSSLVAMFRSQGVDVSDMKVVKHSFNPKSLLNGETDLMAAYISNEPFILKELGGEPLIFSSKDYGFDFYNDILTVSKSYLNANKKEVKNFTKATLKGFEYAFKNIDETINIILKKYNTLKKSRKALQYEAKELKKLAYYKVHKIGKIDTKKLDKIYDVYKLFGLATFGLDMDDIVYDKLISQTKLTKDEKSYLSSKKDLKVCISPEWGYPFMKIDKINNKYSGIVLDYLDILKKKLHTNLTILKSSSWKETLKFIHNQQCDIIPLALKSEDKMKIEKFTKPYLKIPLVITTNNDVSFIEDEKDLFAKKIALIKDSYLKHYFKENNYNLDFIYVENSQEGFKKVKNGQAFAFINSLPSTISELRTSQYSQYLKISGKLPKHLNIHMAVKFDDDKLYSIIQKVIDSIPREKKQRIFNKWLPLKYETKMDYILLIKIILVSILIFGVLVYWNRNVTYQNKLLEDKQKEIEEKNKLLNKLANTDSLTQLYNRGKIEQLLEEKILNSLKGDEIFSICLLDVDFFKKINDTYGHQVGDKVLVELAKLLNTHTRKSDYIGRWGGEEFLIIFPEATQKELPAIVENLRIKIKEFSFEELGNITVSIGSTTYKKDDTIRSIIKRVDEALYDAKDNGRDCVIIK